MRAIAYCRKSGLAGVARGVDVIDDDGDVNAVCSSLRLCGSEEPVEGIVCDQKHFSSTIHTRSRHRLAILHKASAIKPNTKTLTKTRNLLMCKFNYTHLERTFDANISPT